MYCVNDQFKMMEDAVDGLTVENIGDLTIEGPRFCQLVKDADEPCFIVVSNNPRYSDARNYLVVEFL